MVRVPSAFDSGIGQQRNNDVPIVGQNIQGANATAFGARQGQQLQQLGQAGAQGAVMWKRVQDQEDQAKGNEAYTKASDELRDYLNNPETGVYSKQGADALDVYKNTLGGLDEIRERNIEGLSEGAKKRLDDLWQRKRESVLDTVSRYEIKQRNEYKTTAAEATVETSVTDAAENFNNPGFVQQSIEVGEAAIKENMAGKPAEAVEIRLMQFRDSVHSTVIQRMMDNGDAAGAKEYFDSIKDKMTPVKRDSVKEVVNEGIFRATAQTAAGEIMQKNQEYAGQEAAAGRIKDEKLRAEVMDIIDQTQSENARVTEETQKKLSADAWDKVIQTGNRNSIPTDQWVALDEQTKKEIKLYTKRGGAEAKTDPQRWGRLYQMYSQNPEEFKKLNLMNEINGLSTSDFKDFTKKQQDLLDGNNGDQARTRTDLAIAKTRLKQIGIKTDGGLSKKEAEQNTMFFRAFDEKKQQFVDENNRKPNETEVEQMIDELTVKMVFDDSVLPFTADRKFAFELTGDEELEALEVPDDMRDKILNGYFDAYGFDATPPSEDEIRRAYLIKLRGNQ